ncbi:1,2-dihydroxy-3-keto-5-methylthiopentene dioxygenase [Rubrivivax gelatinosus]|uniref:acireductone dioxygenase (Fe(2+)-requiring) n=1 Tax=Rubrivivax gelatinosus TaxID=28068 RepID=A0ABS1DZS6_RUBGE|nr:hypothetical protein [Rubrivivax gelatinosus]MBK1714137.1 hypothetical protein [Rubrivivax gelatinosus]
MQVWLFDGEGAVREHARGTGAGVALLARLGVEAGRVEIEPDADSGHHAALQALRERYGIVHEDRVVLRPGDPAWPPLRARFLEEHTHTDLELRIFVNGRGLFHVRLPVGELAVLCTAGDWIAVPAGVAHRYDGGHSADFEALRFFSRAQGWEAAPTGAGAPTLPLLDELLAGRVAAAATAVAGGR